MRWFGRLLARSHATRQDAIPKYFFTTHFWGPLVNWSVPLAALADFWSKPADVISPRMTAALLVYSALFMRFAWVVQPRNYLLLACHASNEAAQAAQMARWLALERAE